MTDCEFLASLLADGEKHSLNEILQASFRLRGCGLTVHSRAAELRKRGYDIRNTHDPEAKRGAASLYQMISAPQESTGEPSFDWGEDTPVDSSGAGEQTTVWDFVS